MVIVDTSVWIEAFRAGDSVERREVDRLLDTDQVAIVGPVLAEVLQGARSQQEFAALHRTLSVLEFIPETKSGATRAGNVSYQLRRRGAAVGLVDLLIVALALEGGHQVYTLDEHFQRIPGLQLYSPSTVTNLTGVKAISFDVDGTLWDFTAVMRRSLGKVLQELERFDPDAAAMLSVDRLIEIRDRAHEDLKGRVLDLEEVRREGFRRALECVGMPDEELASRLATVYFKHRYSKAALFDDVRLSLKALTANYTLGVISNGNSYLTHLGLDDVFDFVVYGPDHGGIEKPDPRIFQIALKAASCSADQLLHVGDSLESDVEGAANAGIRSAWLNRNGDPHDGARGADLEIASLGELREILTTPLT
jgi:2-haloalkanoic acid dehalogenase type II